MRRICESAIVATDTHPVYSEDRAAFVPVGSLAVGERVRTADGWAMVESLARERGDGRPTLVCNLEVEGEHTFLVGELGLVSHNDSVMGGGGGCNKALSPLRRGEGGRFGDLRGRAITGDGLTPHHMPQAALGFTNRADGGAIVVLTQEHRLTRTYLNRGVATAKMDAALPFRTVLAKDIRDLRSIAGSSYNDGVRGLLEYYRERFPNLIAK